MKNTAFVNVYKRDEDGSMSLEMYGGSTMSTIENVAIHDATHITQTVRLAGDSEREFSVTTLQIHTNRGMVCIDVYNTGEV